LRFWIGRQLAHGAEHVVDTLGAGRSRQHRVDGDAISAWRLNYLIRVRHKKSPDLQESRRKFAPVWP
jgi:hypothetical protein